MAENSEQNPKQNTNFGALKLPETAIKTGQNDLGPEKLVQGLTVKMVNMGPEPNFTAKTETHTHTHIYIYIYIYVHAGELLVCPLFGLFESY